MGGRNSSNWKKKKYTHIYIYIKYCEFLHKANEEDEKMKPTD